MESGTTNQQAVLTELSTHLAGGGKAVGYAGTPFPVELAEALDLLPVPLLALGHCHDSGIEAEWMDDKEDADVRSVFVRAMRGDLARLSGIISLRTTDHVHYYLREVTRRGAWADAVPLHILDIMPLRGDGIARYNRQSMERLVAFLERIAGKPLEHPALAKAVAASNAQRARLRTIDTARRDGGVTGSAAFAALLGSDLPRSNENPRKPRFLLISSAPLADVSLHRLVEHAGGNVVAEEDGSGRFNPAQDLVLGDNPIGALAEFYTTVPMALSHPREDRTAFIDRRITEGGIEAALFVMHRGDLRLGWDYPVLRDRLASAGIPCAMVRADANTDEGSAEIRAAAAALVKQVKG